MLKKKPEWVPQWVWDECAAFLALPGSDTGIAEERHANGDRSYIGIPGFRAFAMSLLSDPDCAVVWKSIDARQGNRNKGVWHAIIDDPPPGWATKGDAWLVINSAWSSSRGLSAQDRVPAADRTKRGKKIQKLAQQLRDELKKLGDGFEGSFEIERTLLEHAYQSAFKAGFVPGDEKNSCVAEKALHGAFRATMDIDDLLVKIANGAKEWADFKHPVKHLTSPNADRHWFINQMTKIFCEEFGSPLLECVAALTRSIYKCEDVDTDLVSRQGH